MSAVLIVASFPAAPFYARVVGRLRAVAGCRQGAPDDEFDAFVARALGFTSGPHAFAPHCAGRAPQVI